MTQWLVEMTAESEFSAATELDALRARLTQQHGCAVSQGLPQRLEHHTYCFAVTGPPDLPAQLAGDERVRVYPHSRMVPC